MIPTYNRAKYLERTLKSVLKQDPGLEEIQIEVIDGCSTKDDSETVVKEVGKDWGSFFWQPQNVGVLVNLITYVYRAKGYWVHILVRGCIL
jgi:glycosyltransferase involved in cell wall biosynthesis